MLRANSEKVSVWTGIVKDHIMQTFSLPQKNVMPTLTNLHPRISEVDINELMIHLSKLSDNFLTCEVSFSNLCTFGLWSLM